MSNEFSGHTSDPSSPYARSFPAAAPADAHWTERVVTQSHADYCAAHGHATWTEDGVTIPRCPRCGEATAPAEDAPATPAPCTHWECALMGDTCVETGAPALMPPRTPRTYTARRIAARFYEYVDEDGGPAEVCDDETFNVDATPHRIAAITGQRYGDRGGVVVGGAGMDMTFALVYGLSRRLYPNGHRCTGTGYTPTGKRSKTPRCPSNDHFNDRGAPNYARSRQHSDGGYALTRVHA